MGITLCVPYCEDLKHTVMLVANEQRNCTNKQYTRNDIKGCIREYPIEFILLLIIHRARAS